ncbi:MAG TPA: hypothetical protein VJ870_14330 [Amycolatopsis sp.]|nr:hypothetical protein [Amycolatopsis sp.]
MPTLDRFAKPPVTDVELTAWFDPIRTIKSLHLAPLKIAWASALPLVEENTPLAPWQPGASFAFLEDGWPMPSCVFSSRSGERNVLIQDDRFSLTWSFAKVLRYPGFAALRADFASRFDEFIQASADAENHDPHIRQITVDYENLLEGFNSDEVAKSVLLDEQISCAAAEAVRPGSAGFRKEYDHDGTKILLGIDPVSPDDYEGDAGENTPWATLLSVHAQVGFEEGDWPADRIRDAHAAANRFFLSLFDDSLKAQWGCGL